MPSRTPPGVRTCMWAERQNGGVTNEAAALGRGRLLAGWVLALLGPVALTVALTPLDNGALSFEAMLFLVVAVGCALVGGRWPAIVASVLGTGLLNYFFTPPLHTLSIASAQNVGTLVVFLLTSVAVAAVVDSAARRRHQAGLARAEAETLAMLNRTVLGGTYDVPRLLDLVRETFEARTCELVRDDIALGPHDVSAQAGPGLRLVLRDQRLDPPGRRILTAFATHLGVLREREELARQTAAARELEAGNRTRTALLAAVSHDLRTPLAGIRSAAETLSRHGDRLTPEDRRELMDALSGATVRLTRMVDDLLDMSRLQTGAVRPVYADVPLREVARAALVGLDGADRVEVGDLPPARVDAGLLTRVLANLLANALRHSRRVEVTGEAHGLRVCLQVVDHGPGVPTTEREAIFAPFQRRGDASVGDGVGLGLAVARGLTEAQGGRLTAAETAGGGLTMTLDLAGVDA